MDSFSKYIANRDKFQDGDIILCHSKKPVAKIIRSIDRSYYHHSEIIFRKHGRVFGLGAHPEGNDPAWLSKRMKKKKWDDFMVIRLHANNEQKQYALERVFTVAEKFNKYDFMLLLGIAIHALTGSEKLLNKNSKFICSELTQYYGMLSGVNEYFPHNLKRPYFTPHDHLRFGKFEIIC